MVVAPRGVGSSEDRANVTRATIHTQTVDEDGMRLRARRCEALLDALRAASSATAALSAWARSRGWDERILARKLETATRPAPDDVAGLLGVTPGAPTGFRLVELTSGARVLSRADNWFASARLPELVNAGLRDGLTPFGALIAPLEPRRELLGVTRLWLPVEKSSQDMPQELFRLSAVVTGLYAGARAPLAVVHETYLATLAL
ncbi:hypothetical protein [Camelimonas fluminis]|nr:hypothetical protein [Camelimonas fluminis]